MAPLIRVTFSDDVGLFYGGIQVDPLDGPYSKNGELSGTNDSISLQIGDINYPGSLWYGEHSLYIHVTDTGGNRNTIETTFTITRSSSGGDGGGSCFLVGTPVTLSDGSTKAIEQLKAGDKILAFDEETKQFKTDTIKEVFIFPENDEGYLTINGHIKVSPHHKFYIEDKWVEAGKLKEGDILLTEEGKPQPITSIEYTEANLTVYNLEVVPHHTYIAGGVVVHNAVRNRNSIGPDDPVITK